MTQRPRLQLIAPVQIRLLADVEIYFEQFKKGDIVTVEEHQADDLVDANKAEDVDPAEGLESVNRFTVAKPSKAETKAADTTSAKLAEAAAKPAQAAKPAAAPAADAKVVDVSGTNTTDANATKS